MIKRIITAAALAVAFIIGATVPAHAATDPGPEPMDPLLDYPGLPYWYTLVPTGTICFERMHVQD